MRLDVVIVKPVGMEVPDIIPNGGVGLVPATIGWVDANDLGLSFMAQYVVVGTSVYMAVTATKTAIDAGF